MHGDTSSYSHSTSATKGSYDVCIFDEPIDIKQVKIWPRQDWWLWYRSSNLTLNLYEFATEGSTYSYNDILLANLLYSINITTDGDSWTNYHKTLNIPTISERIIETKNCSTNDIAELPSNNGEVYLVLAVSNYFENYGISDSLNIHTCRIVCPINTYRNNITGKCIRCDDSSSYAYYCNANIGSTTPNDCQECSNHRRLKDKDNVWCSREECQVVYITHDNGLGNEIDHDELYHNLGTSDNTSITKRLSYSLNTLIDYKHPVIHYQCQSLKHHLKNKQMIKIWCYYILIALNQRGIINETGNIGIDNIQLLYEIDAFVIVIAIAVPHNKPGVESIKHNTFRTQERAKRL